MKDLLEKGVQNVPAELSILCIAFGRKLWKIVDWKHRNRSQKACRGWAVCSTDGMGRAFPATRHCWDCSKVQQAEYRTGKTSVWSPNRGHLSWWCERKNQEAAREQLILEWFTSYLILLTRYSTGIFSHVAHAYLKGKISGWMASSSRCGN